VGDARRTVGRVAIDIRNGPQAAFFRRAHIAPPAPQDRRRSLQRLLTILACPRCREGLAGPAEGCLRCPRCQSSFPVVGGVPIMVLGEPADPVDPGRLASPPSNNPYPPEVTTLLEETLAGSGIVLDLGSGRRTFGAAGLVQLEICTYPFTDVVSQGEQLPFHDACFDFVLSRAVTEHVRRPWVLAAEMQRVLKPGGLLLVDSAFLQPLHGYPRHYYNMTHLALRDLFEGLEVISLGTQANQHPWFVLSWVLDHMLADLPPAERELLTGMKLGQFLEAVKGECRDRRDEYFRLPRGGPPTALSLIELPARRVEELALGFTLLGRKKLRAPAQ
jgi:uncharacterized protein YbaR (Trm112 family)/SAM-dependent methyltransferase